MRKIKSQAERDKRKQRNQIIIGVLLVGLMVFSSLGYSLMDSRNNSSGTKKVSVGGVSFVNANNLWEIENTALYFNYLPTELENFSIEGNYNLEDYSNQILYFVNYNVQGELIINNLRGQIERYQEACLDSSCGKDLPIKNCEEDRIIIFTDSEENKVYQEGGCVFITKDYAKGVDVFIYKLFGLR